MKKPLLALLLTVPALATPWTLTPGSSLGPVRLGQSYLQANQVLTPKTASGNKVLGYLSYEEGAVGLECRNQQITQIFVYKTQFTGKSGSITVQVPGNLQIGCSDSQLQTALGRATLVRPLPVAKGQPAQVCYTYNRMGLGARCVGGRVVEFSVWPPRP